MPFANLPTQGSNAIGKDGEMKLACYVVSYDLHTPGQKYDCLTKKLEAYGTHWHAQGSVWFVVTTSSATDIRDNLNACLDSNDKLIVAKLSREAAWTGYSDSISAWLKKHL